MYATPKTGKRRAARARDLLVGTFARTVLDKEIFSRDGSFGLRPSTYATSVRLHSSTREGLPLVSMNVIHKRYATRYCTLSRGVTRDILSLSRKRQRAPLKNRTLPLPERRPRRCPAARCLIPYDRQVHYTDARERPGR